MYYRGNNDELDNGGRRDEEVGGRNGDVLGLRRVRTQEATVRHQTRKRQGPGQYSNVQPDFRIPVTRGVRPTTADGRTSFHFKHSVITKTAEERVDSTGVANRPGAARAHGKYIEREGAVAIVDNTNQLSAGIGLAIGHETIAGQGTDQGCPDDQPFDAPLARNRDPADQARHREMLRRVARVKAALDEQFHPDVSDRGPVGLSAAQHISTIPMLGNLRYGSVPARHGGYVERPEALALLDDGSPAIFTNISADARERQAFWDKVEARAQKPGPDVVKFTGACSAAFLHSLANARLCPADLALALEQARYSPPLETPVLDLEAVKKLILGHPQYDAEQPQAVFAPGRGGRIQYRIVGELPHDLPLENRAQILEEFAQEFGKRGLPYVAAMHAPDHNNDDRNWHFHLDYYGHPAARMPDGRWDFEVGVTTVDKHRNRRTRYPHRQKRCADVNSIQWIPGLRKRLADITNAHLIASKIDRRLDPRTYEEMGIPRKPQKHVGTKASALEARGIPTEVGAANAAKDWDELLTRLVNDSERKKQEAIAEAQRRRIEAGLAVRTPSVLRDAELLIDRSLVNELEALELLFLAKDVEHRTERALSRARKTAATGQRNIDAIDAGRVKAGGVRKRPEHIDSRDQANAYIQHMREPTQAASQLIEDLKVEAERLRRESTRDVRNLDLLIAEVRSAGGAIGREAEVSSSSRELASSPSVTGTGFRDADGRAAGATCPEPSGASEQSPSPSAIGARSVSLPPPDFDAMFKQFHARPARFLTRNDKLIPDETILEGLGISLVQITSEPMQRRLRGLATAQERERKRLESYARSRPSGLVPGEAGLSFDDRSPVELRQLHQKWRDDAAYQDRLSEILDDARRALTPLAASNERQAAPYSPAVAAGATPYAQASIADIASPRGLVEPSAMAKEPMSPPVAPPATAAERMRPRTPRPGVHRLSPEQVQRATDFASGSGHNLAPSIPPNLANTPSSLGTPEASNTISDKRADDEQRRIWQASLDRQQQLDRGPSG